jgi:hypothetical protein
MITASQLKPFRRASDDYSETERLKALIAERRNERGHLALNEFDEICHWKLRTQYGRVRRFLERNTDDIVRAVTGVNFRPIMVLPLIP